MRVKYGSVFLHPGESTTTAPNALIQAILLQLFMETRNETTLFRPILLIIGELLLLLGSDIGDALATSIFHVVRVRHHLCELALSFLLRFIVIGGL